MKKKLLLVLITAILTLSAFALVGCGGPGNNTTQVSLSGYTEKDDMVFGKIYTKSFPNSQIVYPVYNDVTVGSGSTWTLSVDIFGNETIESKTIPLLEGDNQYYVLVKNTKGEVRQYVIVARRRPIYEVSFSANGYYIPSQQIEEDSKALEPTAIPTRAGYTFDGWNFDFSAPIKSTKIIYAKWKGNTDMPYKTEYYKQNLNDDNYTLYETVSGSGTTGASVSATIKSYTGFTYNSSKSTTSGTINANGSTTLKVYYTRNIYTLSANDSSLGSITNAGSYKYGSAPITSVATLKDVTADFLGWYNGDVCVSISKTYTFTAEYSVVAKFQANFDFENFNYTTSGTTVNITGVKDKSITSIVIPNSVTSIGYGAFSGCSSLTSVTIPNSVTSIGDYAFYDCSSLTKVNYTGTIDQWVQIEFGGSVLSSTRKLYINDTLVTNANITTATKINVYAFCGCSSLTSVTIGNSVTSIGREAFEYCSSLESITIPNSVTSIGEWAFYNCSSLTSITIGNSVTRIEDYVFYNCSSLTSITISNSVKSIGNYAFNGCSSLTIYCEATEKPDGWNIDWNYSNRPVYWYSETEPTTSGNYWHYVDGVVTKWE